MIPRYRVTILILTVLIVSAFTICPAMAAANTEPDTSNLTEFNPEAVIDFHLDSLSLALGYGNDFKKLNNEQKAEARILDIALMKEYNKLPLTKNESEALEKICKAHGYGRAKVTHALYYAVRPVYDSHNTWSDGHYAVNMGWWQWYRQQYSDDRARMLYCPCDLHEWGYPQTAEEKKSMIGYKPPSVSWQDILAYGGAAAFIAAVAWTVYLCYGAYTAWIIHKALIINGKITPAFYSVMRAVIALCVTVETPILVELEAWLTEYVQDNTGYLYFD